MNSTVLTRMIYLQSVFINPLGVKLKERKSNQSHSQEEKSHETRKLNLIWDF